MISASIYNPIGEVFNHIAVLALLDVYINRIKEMESMPIQQGTTDYSVDNYDIAFDGVDFSYETGKQVLRNVSFTARQGEVTALVGPSGGGKSTSAKLAARFWDIDKGTITLGGQDISKIDPEALLKNYAVVFQDVLLFNSSVADNIRIGKASATQEEVETAARRARIHDFITGLPNGYDTLAGEAGGKFSGGNTIRLYIGLGRKDGTSKRSLAQFFSTLLSIPEHAVDHIELFDRFSLADLPADAAHEALRLSKKKANMPHIHIDTKSDSVNEKSPHTAGYTKKSPSRKLREGNRREAFFRDKDTRKKHPVSAGSAAAYKKRLNIQKNRKVSINYIRSIIHEGPLPNQTGLLKFRKFFTGK